MAHSRVGIWFVGARGGVAATTIVGLAALRRGITEQFGLVSTLPAFAGLDLAQWDQFAIGGHEIRESTLLDEAMRLATESRAIDADLIRACGDDLEAIDQSIRPGTVINVGGTIHSLASSAVQQRSETPRAAIRRVQDDLREFCQRAKVDRLIVVNLASTEPPPDIADLPVGWTELDSLLDLPEQCPLPASSLYAIAALDLGHAYVNFTPSLGAALPALVALAEQRGTCLAGRDGKTGETLLKSVLAPMFAQRNLHVMSWVGHNIFGNMDGVVLTDPANKAAKVTSKDKLLGEILGYTPQSLVTIEYIKSLGDWKTAWDHVHFQGFLGTPMTLQFTWQGCDSLLAAPLVIDLIRFTERAGRAGQTGVLSFLASFFKSPQGVCEPTFARQYEMLLAWAQSLA